MVRYIPLKGVACYRAFFKGENGMNDIGRVLCSNRFVMALLRENGICNIISIVIKVCSLEEEG